MIAKLLRRNGMLPVVMGAPTTDYEKVTPPYSYIHVDDFAGPQQLGEYLHFLSENDTEYKEYFRWKQSFQLTYYQNSGMFWCRLCTLLNYQVYSSCEVRAV